MAIDLHAHWIPPSLAELLRTRQQAPRIERDDAREWLVTFQGRRPFAALGDLSDRRAFMARHGVRMQVLSLPGLFGVDSLPVRDAAPLVAAFNDAVAEVCRAEPARFAGLAALPFADIAEACRELERAHALGLAGAILPADGFASAAAAERFRPLLARAQRLGCHVFIHPGPLEPRPERPVYSDPHDHAWLRRIVLETQARLSEVMVTLNLTTLLDPYPDVTVQVANLGGAVPFLLERMDEVYRDPSLREAAPSARMRRCYVDSATFGPRGIALAVACFGADRVVFGSDCPIFDTGRVLEAVAAASIDDDARHRILYGNAQQLLRRREEAPL